MKFLFPAHKEGWVKAKVTHCGVCGSICITSVHKAPHAIDLRAINFKEQTVIGTRAYTREDFGRAVDLLPVLQPELEKIVSHVLPLSQGATVFDIINDPNINTLKVVVDCQK